MEKDKPIILERDKKPMCVYLAPDIILRAIINNDEQIDVILLQKKMDVITSAFCFWEVISCLSKEEIKEHSERIFELLHKIKITDLAINGRDAATESEDRIKHLRKIALKATKVKELNT